MNIRWKVTAPVAERHGSCSHRCGSIACESGRSGVPRTALRFVLHYFIVNAADAVRESGRIWATNEGTGRGASMHLMAPLGTNASVQVARVA